MGHAKCGVMLFGAARENANDLKRERMDSSKLESGMKMGMIVGSQKRFLCNYRIPAQLRVKVLESVVLTSGLYGAEVWVYAETRTTHRRYKRSYTKV